MVASVTRSSVPFESVARVPYPRSCRTTHTSRSPTGVPSSPGSPRTLEHAAGIEPDPKRRTWFESRAMRIRKRLHDGVPEDFDGTPGHQRMNRRR